MIAPDPRCRSVCLLCGAALSCVQAGPGNGASGLATLHVIHTVVPVVVAAPALRLCPLPAAKFLFQRIVRVRGSTALGCLVCGVAGMFAACGSWLWRLGGMRNWLPLGSIRGSEHDFWPCPSGRGSWAGHMICAVHTSCTSLLVRPGTTSGVRAPCIARCLASNPRWCA